MDGSAAPAPRPGEPGRPARASLILASRSPQRTAILRQLGVPHVAVPADVVELAAGDPSEVARENAHRKARAVADARGALAPGVPPAHAGMTAGDVAAGAVVLGADTVVALDATILPKPVDERQARRWLQTLSGRTHRVFGGLCVAHGGACEHALAVTDVTFRELDDATLDWYLATGEWRERAGGYAIQGRGAALVERIAGDYLNVVGLPVGALLALLPGLLAGEGSAAPGG